MPELPEVHTTATMLNELVSNERILSVWTDYKSAYHTGRENIKDPKYFKKFTEEIIDRKIIEVFRRAKNVLIDVDGDKTILIHMKMTGHIMYGDYNRKDPFNRFIHFIITLSNNETMELCDTRKFAKVTLIGPDNKYNSIHLKDIGPEPLEKSFTFKIFKEQLYKKPNKEIKTVLLNQEIIAGIGNIYSDESLWRAGIYPKEKVINIPENKLKKLYKAIQSTLLKGIDFGGDSMSDYRNIHGEKGKFQEQHRAYRKTGTLCSKKNCKGKIIRIMVGGRSTHYCDIHQKQYKV